MTRAPRPVHPVPRPTDGTRTRVARLAHPARYLVDPRRGAQFVADHPGLTAAQLDRELWCRPALALDLLACRAGELWVEAVLDHQAARLARADDPAVLPTLLDAGALVDLGRSAGLVAALRARADRAGWSADVSRVLLRASTATPAEVLRAIRETDRFADRARAVWHPALSAEAVRLLLRLDAPDSDPDQVAAAFGAHGPEFLVAAGRRLAADPDFAEAVLAGLRAWHAKGHFLAMTVPLATGLGRLLGVVHESRHAAWAAAFLAEDDATAAHVLERARRPVLRRLPGPLVAAVLEGAPGVGGPRVREVLIRRLAVLDPATLTPEVSAEAAVA